MNTHALESAEDVDAARQMDPKSFSPSLSSPSLIQAVHTITINMHRAL